MLNQLSENLLSIGLAIIGVAFLAVLVSKNSNTASILQNYFSGISNSLGVAESPVTGASVSINTSYAGSSGLDGASGGFNTEVQ